MRATTSQKKPTMTLGVFAAEGNYAQALERHIWFHEHALHHKPKYCGVRLSFALGSWMKLGENDPPALASLKAARDQDSANLYEGDPCDDLFRDVVAINHQLGDDSATFAMFQHFEDTDAVVASRRFGHLKNEACETEPDLFMKYVDDLEKYFEGACELQVLYNQSFLQALARYTKENPDFITATARIATFQQKFRVAAAKICGMAIARSQHDVASRINDSAETILREIQAILK